MLECRSIEKPYRLSQFRGWQHETEMAFCKLIDDAIRAAELKPFKEVVCNRCGTKTHEAFPGPGWTAPYRPRRGWGCAPGPAAHNPGRLKGGAGARRVGSPAPASTKPVAAERAAGPDPAAGEPANRSMEQTTSTARRKLVAGFGGQDEALPTLRF